MANTEGENRRSLVTTLQTPGAVVTYRAFVGIMASVIVALLAIIGNNLMDGQRTLAASMTRVQLSVARNSGRIDDQGERLSRMEQSNQAMGEKFGDLDHRVTVMEARQSFH
jgi:hypothetical protein